METNKTTTDRALVEVKTGAEHLPAVRAPEAFNLTPRTLDEAFRLAEVLAASDMVPKDYRGKAANVLVAVQWGHEIGLKPLQALQNLAVINGRPSLWGDALVALVRSSSVCEYVVESFDEAGTAVCQVKRRGEQEQVRTFSDADAKTAGLLGKEGPWRTNPKRMKQMRARAFALRDVFADVLKGMQVAEEVMDLPAEATATPIDQIPGTAPAVPKELADAAMTAAKRGVGDYEAFWKGLTKEQRVVAQFQHGTWKTIAAEADRAAKAEAAAEPAAEPASEPEAGGGAA